MPSSSLCPPKVTFPLGILVPRNTGFLPLLSMLRQAATAYSNATEINHPHLRGGTIVYLHLLLILSLQCLQCFDAVGWAAGRASGLYKTEWWGAGVVICLERGADLHMAQLMSLPLTVSCFSKIQTGFTFLVPAHPGSPGQRAVKRLCMCVSAASSAVLRVKTNKLLR